jgi:hypothetical protein
MRLRRRAGKLRLSRSGTPLTFLCYSQREGCDKWEPPARLALLDLFRFVWTTVFAFEGAQAMARALTRPVQHFNGNNVAGVVSVHVG